MTKMQALKSAEAARDQLKAKIAELQQQLIGAEMMLRHLRGETTAAVRPRAPRSNVKNYILTLLEEAGERGLNAARAVEIAESKGDTLERGTVSSLLSRLKADGVVVYDGSLYRLSKHANAAAGNTSAFAAPNPFH